MKGCGEGTVREFMMDIYTLLYLKWITSKDLQYSTWNTVCSMLCGSRMGGQSGGGWIHVYTWLTPLVVHLKLSSHC